MWLYMIDDKLMVNEIFTSIEGEGKRAGALVNFVRLAGCNLRCSYCDTKYALSPTDGKLQSVDDIITQLKATRIKKVTITGGEPLTQPNIYFFLQELVTHEFEVNVETNGSIDLGLCSEIFDGTNSFITMDVKCPTSGVSWATILENKTYLQTKDVIKFVVGSEEDLNYMMNYIKNIRNLYLYASPVFGEITAEEIVNFIKEHSLINVRVQLQLHKYIWDPNKRGV